MTAVAYSPDASAQRRQSLADRVTALEAKLATAGSNEDRQTLTDMVFRLSELEEELRQLRGQVENQTFELENIRKGELDRYNDLDRRLRELAEQQALPAPGQLSRPLSAGASPSQAARRPASNVANNGNVGPGGGRQPAQTGGPSSPAASTPEQAEAAYDVAFQALKDGRYDESARLFSGFLEVHPGSDLADNAQYWLGESYYVTRNYKIGQETFKDLLELFPDSDKVPDARLKLGFSQLALKQYPQARETLTAVSREYPGTPVARLAENRLRTMRIEGHIQ